MKIDFTELKQRADLSWQELIDVKKREPTGKLTSRHIYVTFKNMPSVLKGPSEERRECAKQQDSDTRFSQQH